MRLPPTLALLALLFACAAPQEEPAPSAAGGSGGGAPEECADLAATGTCRFEGPDSGCTTDEVCAPDASRSCGDERCCTLRLACQPPIGLVPGGFACTVDGDCESGLCLAVAGQGICLRACEVRGGTESTCPDGLGCAVLSLDATRSVRGCVGLRPDGSFDSGPRLCRHDGDCDAGRYCRVEQGDHFYEGVAYGLCHEGARSPGGSVACESFGPLEYGELTESASHMTARGVKWSAACVESGFCHNACYGLAPDVCACRVGGPDDAFCRAERCTQPCRRDDDCPSPTVCLPAETEEFVSIDPDVLFKLCLLPNYDETNWGCWDETDCCVGGLQRSGRHCCLDKDDICLAPAPDVTHCRVAVTGARWASRCELPAGLAELDAPCALHEACESGLCGPDGRCTSPCDPGAGDRCGEVRAGSSCCPMPVGDACVPACRTDCATGPSCVR